MNNKEMTRFQYSKTAYEKPVLHNNKNHRFLEISTINHSYIDVSIHSICMYIVKENMIKDKTVFQKKV